MSSRQYVFGYGSLVSAEDVARTLGRTPALIYPVELNGWIREWGVVIDNADADHRCIRLPDGSIVPGHIVVLNVRRPAPDEKPTNPNGVLFEVTDSDLVKLDSREAHYRRLEVTTNVINRPAGVIYTYTGYDQFLVIPEKTRTVIPGSYSDLVARSFATLGPDMHDKYLTSTRATDLPILYEPAP